MPPQVRDHPGGRRHQQVIHMAHQQSPTNIVVPLGRRRVGLEDPPSALNLHLVAGWWVASCPT